LAPECHDLKLKLHAHAKKMTTTAFWQVRKKKVSQSVCYVKFHVKNSGRQYFKTNSMAPSIIIIVTEILHDFVLVGQEKIVRAFSEIMKNMSRMKTCIRPAMCKPYGKQSESLQKSK